MGSTGQGFAGFAGYHQHVSTSHKGADPDSLLNLTLPLDVATHQPLSDPQAAQFTGLHHHRVPLCQTLPPATVLPTSGLPTSPTAALSTSNLSGDAVMADEDDDLLDDAGQPDADVLMHDVHLSSPPPADLAALPPLRPPCPPSFAAMFKVVPVRLVLTGLDTKASVAIISTSAHIGTLTSPTYLWSPTPPLSARARSSMIRAQLLSSA